VTSETFLDGRVTLHIGDVRAKLRELPADHFDCVVTSPPYWGLRDYGTGRWEGGDPDCEHRSPTMRDGRNEARAQLAGSAATNSAQLLLAHRSACGKCGAVKVDHQIGLEPTLSEHLTVMVEVFEEVRRVLKPTGTLWLNYGDCYATSPNGRSAAATKAAGNDDRTFRDKPFSTMGEIGGKRITAGEDRSDVDVGGWGASDDSLRWRGGGVLKAKDLCMIPNRLAIALQEAGWYVRSEIIWHKPNPMPESITDRPTTSHEKVWLMSKSERYVYDSDAIREPVTASTIDRLSQDVESQIGSDRANGGMKTNGRMKAVGRNSRANVDRVPRSRKLPPKDDGREDQGLRTAARFGGGAGWREEGLRDDTRNSRNVWTIPTSSFSEAHFATFPPALVERCIKAGCPVGGRVLDIFGGAGTTGLVAATLGRQATLIELNPEYAILARARN
jgi:DNA modification methylase